MFKFVGNFKNCLKNIFDGEFCIEKRIGCAHFPSKFQILNLWSLLHGKKVTIDRGRSKTDRNNINYDNLQFQTVSNGFLSWFCRLHVGHSPSSAHLGRAVISYWGKKLHQVLVKCFQEACPGTALLE